MLAAEEGGEGSGVLIPIIGGADVAALTGDGVIALSAQVGRIDGGAGQMAREVEAEVLHVVGGSGDAVEANYYEFGFSVRQPALVGEGVVIEGSVVLAMEGGAGGGGGHGGGSAASGQQCGHEDGDDGGEATMGWIEHEEAGDDGVWKGSPQDAGR